MKLWIDDLRDTPDGGPGWCVARTSEGAIQFLRDYAAQDGTILGVLELISFDHDLGDGDDTRRVLTWMIENDTWPEEVRFHTMNPVGRQWLVGTARRYAPSWVEVSVS